MSIFEAAAERDATSRGTGASPSLDGSMSMQDTCRQFGLTPRTVRYYEQRGLITAVRDRLNRRRFPHEARQRLAIIASLRAVGVDLQTIQGILSLQRRSFTAADARMLEDLRTEADNLARQRAALTCLMVDLASEPR